MQMNVSDVPSVAAFVLHAQRHFEFHFLFGVRISFPVRETRPLWETSYSFHAGLGERLSARELTEHWVTGSQAVCYLLVFSCGFQPSFHCRAGASSSPPSTGSVQFSLLKLTLDVNHIENKI